MPGQSIPEAEARRRGVFRNVLYRAYPTGRDYSFTYELVRGTWRAYINNAPDYRGHDSRSGSAHWLPDGERRYVCWTPEPTTISVAQSISAMWADATEHYIRTGRFEPPQGRPPIRDHSVLGDRALSSPTSRDGSLHSRAPRLPAHTGRQGVIAWYGERRFQLWGGGLAALFLCGLLWIGCMSNGFGFWDLVWLVGAGTGGVAAATRAEHQPGGRGWIVCLASTIAVLGVWQLGVGAPPWFVWTAFWVAAIACGVQFGRAAANA